ncbi:MAG: adenylate/guanylate cyclase domain-containing protein [Armatimonadetes bacterium]|nr:adenylate/guanylate cyclase domain-containing protein [Armatimonadota bacterium]MDW8121689.1 adenylate/guanylate cyclase domain-containing protein [Armatimonadota bacterium]
MKEWQKALAGTIVLMALVRLSGIGDGIQRWLTDQHWRWKASYAPVSVPPGILIIAIDDATLRKFGRLSHWSRRRYAELIKKLSQAKAIGLDILFVEPDRLDPEGDRAFAEAVKQNGKIVIPFHIWKEARPLSPSDQKALSQLVGRLPKSPVADGDLPFTPTHLLQPPLDGLVRTAQSLGYADLNADPDGVYRTPILLRRTGEGRLLPHFVLSLACLASGTTVEKALLADRHLDLNGRRIALVSGSLPLHPFVKRGGASQADGDPIRQISFADALTKDPSFFKDAIILVGETAAGTTDIRPNPLDPGLRGVELNGEILANLLYLDPVQPVPGWINGLLIMLMVGLPLWLYNNRSAAFANGASLSLLLSLLVLLEVFFWIFGWIPNWSFLFSGWLGATGLMALQRLRQEEERKRLLRETFSLYVAPELVQQILKAPEHALQDARRQKVAVLFSDIRNFTTYSEQTPPEEIVAQMKEYLTEMTQSVMAHRGVLDKFIGDAVMALFGPWLPEDAPLSALALLTAKDMDRRLKTLNQNWVQQGRQPFRIGIGIHCGEAVVGNIGSSQRVQFTALGDTVNLASRLQSLTKELKASVLVSQEAKEEAERFLADQIEFVDKGVITVRGREKPVRIFQAVWKDEKEETEGEVTGSEAVPASQA